MKVETLEKANKIKEEINIMDNHINALSYTIKVKDSSNKERKNKKSVGLLRLLNKFNFDLNEEEEKARVILFDNLNIQGYYDIEIDEEFINYLTKYYNLKKKELEKQLEEL